MHICQLVALSRKVVRHARLWIDLHVELSGSRTSLPWPDAPHSPPGLVILRFAPYVDVVDRVHLAKGTPAVGPGHRDHSSQAQG